MKATLHNQCKYCNKRWTQEVSADGESVYYAFSMKSQYQAVCDAEECEEKDADEYFSQFEDYMCDPVTVELSCQCCDWTGTETWEIMVIATELPQLNMQYKGRKGDVYYVEMTYCAHKSVRLT